MRVGLADTGFLDRVRTMKAIDRAIEDAYASMRDQAIKSVTTNWQINLKGGTMDKKKQGPAPAVEPGVWFSDPKLVKDDSNVLYATTGLRA